jgi:hypothetical protein
MVKDRERRTEKFISWTEALQSLTQLTLSIVVKALDFVPQPTLHLFPDYPTPSQSKGGRGLVSAAERIATLSFPPSTQRMERSDRAVVAGDRAICLNV